MPSLEASTGIGGGSLIDGLMGATRLPAWPHGWERLGRAIVAERSRRWRTRKEFALAVRVSVRVIGDLERGRRSNYLDSTLAAVEGSLGWAPGSCERIIAGGRPAREMDPLLSRLLDAWPQLPPEARTMLVEVAERALR